MFSTGNNIENIASLVENLKEYLSLRLDYTKYSLTEKLVRIVKVLTLIFVILALLSVVLIFLSFAAAFAISNATNSYSIGFLSVGCAYLIIMITVYLKRKAWIERPLIKFISSIILK